MNTGWSLATSAETRAVSREEPRAAGIRKQVGENGMGACGQLCQKYDEEWGKERYGVVGGGFFKG